MFFWKYGFNRLLLDAKGEGAEGGGSGGGNANGNSGKTEEEAGATGGASEDDGNDEPLDVATLDPKVQKYIKDLRSENAKTRKKSKEELDKAAKVKQALIDAGLIESDDEAPEEKIKGLNDANAGLQFRSAVLEAAVEHSVPKGQIEYFEFLVSKAVAALEDGAELPQEELAALAKKAKQAAGVKANTSVDGNQGGEGGSGSGTPPPGGDTGVVTVDQFVKMNMGEKAALYDKKPDVYAKLLAEAKNKKILVR